MKRIKIHGVWKWILIFTVPILIFYFINIGKGQPKDKPIVFAYMERSRTGKSFEDIYNEEFIKYFSRENHLRAEVIKGTYEEVMARRDEIDVFLDYPIVGEETIELFNKSRYTLYVKEKGEVNEYRSGKRIALFERDNDFFKNIVMRYYTNKYTFVDSVEEGFDLLERGEVDGFFTKEDSIYMKNPERKHYESVAFLGSYSYGKTLTILTEDRFINNEMRRFIRWFEQGDMLELNEKSEARLIWYQVNLTEDEVDYIVNKKTIRVGGDFSNFPPLAYTEKKKVKGSITEYMNLLKLGTGLKVYYLEEKDNMGLLKSLENGRIDLMATYSQGNPVIEDVVETGPYFKSVVGIFSLEGKIGRDVERVFDEYDISRGPVGVKIDEGAGRHSFVQGSGVKEFYEMLKEDKIDYFIHSYALLKNLPYMNDMKDLRLYGVLDKKMSITMGAMEENSILIGIIDKMFEYLNHDDIRYRWEMQSSRSNSMNSYKKYVFLLGVVVVFLLPYVLILRVEMEKIKKIEKELQEAQKSLQEALNVKSAFLANMSHEVRTPLTAILGFNKLLERKETDPKKGELIKNVGIAAENLLEFTNNVLDLSKLESGKVEMKLKRINLFQMADELERISLGLKRSDDVEFCFIITEKAPKYFMGDEVWLKEIILNLLGNAFKFTEKGSVQLVISSEDETLLIEVRDTGVGMKNFEDEKENIFKRYEQLDLNENRNKKGSGLGLAIVKEVVELMEGSITVKSVYRVGTTFRISIPIKKKLEISPAARGVKLPERGINEVEGV